MADLHEGKDLYDGYNVHPVAELFPLIEGEEFAELVRDIKTNGLLDPITLSHDGLTIIDGRNRYRACVEGTVDPVFTRLHEHYSEAAIVSIILSRNLARRHLTAGQLSMLGHDLLPHYEAMAKERQRAAGQERQRKDKDNPADQNQLEANSPQAGRAPQAREEAARAVGVGSNSIARAGQIKEASPVLADKVRSGSTSLNNAYKQIWNKPKEDKVTTKPNSEVLQLKTHDGELIPYQRPQSKPKFNLTNEQVDWAAWTWNPVTGCLHNCPYCLSGNTPVLMADGRALPISSLRVGDEIIGTRMVDGYRRLTRTMVLAHWKTVKEAYEIVLANGTTLVCSGDHRWLTNRGNWKYVTGQMSGPDQRPYLTTNNSLMGFGASVAPSAETENYRRGYLSGVIRGDGHLKAHKNPKSKNSVYNSFRLAMNDVEAINRASRYLKMAGVEVAHFQFAMNGTTGEPVQAIRTSSRSAYERISSLIDWMDDPEYRRGFLAGIFDAEGSNNGNGAISTLRIFNSCPEILGTIETALAEQGFRYVYDVDRQCTNKIVRTIRIVGGLTEHIRFFQNNDPAIRRKLKLDNAVIKCGEDLRIVSIKPLDRTEEMFDITTGTEDFIANGVVSHNCYSRELAHRPSYAASYPAQFTPLFHHERLDAPANTAVPVEAETDPRRGRVFVCSMADLYGKWVPREWIEQVHASCIDNPQWQYLMLTKFPQRYLEFEAPKTAWFGTTVDRQHRVKIAETAFRQIKNVYVRWLSLEPLLEPVVFSDLSMFDWIVIGSQTATEQPDGPVPAFAPPFEWVARLIAQAREARIPVYLKPNLLGRIDPQSPGMTLPQEQPTIRLLHQREDKGRQLRLAVT